MSGLPVAAQDELARIITDIVANDYENLPIILEELAKWDEQYTKQDEAAVRSALLTAVSNGWVTPYKYDKVRQDYVAAVWDGSGDPDYWFRITREGLDQLG